MCRAQKPVKGDHPMSKTKLGPQTRLYPMPAVLVGSVVDGKLGELIAKAFQVGKE
jgi:hypothetical protein